MSDVSRLLDLKFGLHAANVYSGTPGTVATIQPRSLPNVFRRSREALARDLSSIDGHVFPRVRGARDLGPISVAMEFRGVNSNSGGAVADWEAKMEQGYMIAGLMGAVAPATSNGATTTSSISGATLTVASGTDIAVGTVIGFVDDGGTLDVRMVLAKAGNDLTLDDGIGTTTASDTVFRFATYSLSTSTTNHQHGYFRAEMVNGRADYFGCAGQSFELNIPNTGLVEFTSSWAPTTWDDAADANPSYTAPTAGSPIVAAASQFHIGGTSYMVRNLRLVVDNGMVSRETTTGTDGVLGAVAARKMVTIEGELYVGDNAGSIGELVDDSGSPALGDLTGDAHSAGDLHGTHSVGLQVGTEIGAAMYLYFPALDIHGAVQDSGGLQVLRFSGLATTPTSGNLTSPFYLGVG